MSRCGTGRTGSVRCAPAAGQPHEGVPQWKWHLDQQVLSAGVSANPRRDLTLTAQLRHFGGAPLIEDGSVRSGPTSLVNVGTFLTLGRVTISGELLNAFDADDSDISYFY